MHGTLSHGERFRLLKRVNPQQQQFSKRFEAVELWQRCCNTTRVIRLFPLSTVVFTARQRSLGSTYYSTPDYGGRRRVATSERHLSLFRGMYVHDMHSTRTTTPPPTTTTERQHAEEGTKLESGEDSERKEGRKDAQRRQPTDACPSQILKRGRVRAWHGPPVCTFYLRRGVLYFKYKQRGRHLRYSRYC